MGLMDLVRPDNLFDIDSIDKHFVKDSYRDGQKECIEFALNAFNSGKKFVILECPTGSGKSTIGMTIADMVNKSYYLTATKILQDQLTGDFGDKIVELKGRNAYPCTLYDRLGDKLVNRKIMSRAQLQTLQMKNGTCDVGFCTTRYNGNKFKCKMCFKEEGPGMKGNLSSLPVGMSYCACPYYEQVYKAINSRKVVMNFMSFLYQTQMTDRFDEPRDLLIIDEAHNVESQLMDFVELSISDTRLQEFGLKIPKFNNYLQYAAWFKDIEFHNKISELIANAKKQENQKLVDDLARILRKYRIFMSDIEGEDSEWVCEYSEAKSKDNKTIYRSVKLKPVFIKNFVNDLLFKYADRVLFMSATILDVNVFCDSLGLERKDVAAYRMKNRFPVENRPIYLSTVAKMTGGKDKMAEWAPKLTKKIDELCLKYKNDKGIIHTHNFAIMEYIINNCDSKTKSRLLNQRDFADKSDMLEYHAKQKNSVLIAPAMHEGIDLHGDLSRFQIVCKVPFANFYEDKQLARRVEIDDNYYKWLTCLKLVQSVGRSIRSETDYADTYILDESIHWFLKGAKRMIPSWFSESLK